jgi:hypothetical protein
MTTCNASTICLDKYATKQEARIARSLVHHALRAGFTIGVIDEEDVAQTPTTDRALILAALAQTSFSALVLFRDNVRAGSVSLIWGNGEDLISDSSAKPQFWDEIEALCGTANRAA